MNTWKFEVLNFDRDIREIRTVEASDRSEATIKAMKTLVGADLLNYVYCPDEPSGDEWPKGHSHHTDPDPPRINRTGLIG